MKTETQMKEIKYKLNLLVQGSNIAVQSVAVAKMTLAGVKKSKEEIYQEEHSTEGKPLIVLQIPTSPIILKRMEEQGFNYKVGDAVYLSAFAQPMNIELSPSQNIFLVDFSAVSSIVPYHEIEVKEFDLDKE